MPTGLLHAPAGMPRDQQRNVARHLRGLPPRHLGPGRAPRRHDAQPRRGGDQLPEHLPALRRPGLPRAGRQGPRPHLPAHLQRLDDRRVVRRRRQGPPHPAHARAALGPASSRPRRCGAAPPRAATPSPSARTRRSSACRRCTPASGTSSGRPASRPTPRCRCTSARRRAMPTTSRRRAARHLDVALRPERPGLALRLGLLRHASSASPTSSIAYAESQVGWMPFQLERMDAVWRDGRRRRRRRHRRRRASRCTAGSTAASSTTSHGLQQPRRRRPRPHPVRDRLPALRRHVPALPQGRPRAVRGGGHGRRRACYKVLRGNAIEAYGLHRFGITK